MGKQVCVRVCQEDLRKKKKKTFLIVQVQPQHAWSWVLAKHLDTLHRWSRLRVYVSAILAPTYLVQEMIIQYSDFNLFQAACARGKKNSEVMTWMHSCCSLVPAFPTRCQISPALTQPNWEPETTQSSRCHLSSCFLPPEVRWKIPSWANTIHHQCALPSCASSS